MSDGIKSWHDDLQEEYYKKNHDKDNKALLEFIDGPIFKRLVELRIKYKELQELKQLEYERENMLKRYGTASYEIQQKLYEGLY